MAKKTRNPAKTSPAPMSRSKTPRKKPSMSLASLLLAADDRRWIARGYPRILDRVRESRRSDLLPRLLEEPERRPVARHRYSLVAVAVPKEPDDRRRDDERRHEKHVLGPDQVRDHSQREDRHDV